MWKFVVTLIAGAVLSFSFAPFHIYSLGFIAPAILLYFWLQCKPYQAFFHGLTFGLGLFGLGTSWVFISIHHFGNAPLIPSILTTLAFVFVLALFIAALGYVFRRVFQHAPEPLQCLLAFPALWVAFEWLRSVAFTGFPWAFLGYSQMETPLKWFAPLIGVYGISLLVTVISGALVVLALRNARALKGLCVVIIIAIVGFGWLLQNHLWTKPEGKALPVSLVQGNVPQSLKWNPKQLQKTLSMYRTLTQKNWSSRFIVWPEAAIPTYPSDVPRYLNSLATQARAHNADILTGIPIFKPNPERYYNGLIILGNNHGEYLKRHLVPFGEYLPMPKLFSWFYTYFKIPMSDFNAGPAAQAPLMVFGKRIAAFICYEIAFPREVLSGMRGNAKNIQPAALIINISDDAWFGKSIALAQQLEMAQMRAVETGRYALSAANTGLTAIIGPGGVIKTRAPIDKRFVLSGNVHFMTGLTPLMRWGYWPLWVLLIVMGLVTLISGLRRDS